MVTNDFHEVLGVGPNATEAEIKIAYREKARLFHPDRNKNPDAAAKFMKVHDAYTILLKKAQSCKTTPYRSNTKNEAVDRTNFENMKKMYDINRMIYEEHRSGCSECKSTNKCVYGALFDLLEAFHKYYSTK
jgi:DnaJ-class molecular chaperone